MQFWTSFIFKKLICLPFFFCLFKIYKTNEYILRSARLQNNQREMAKRWLKKSDRILKIYIQKENCDTDMEFMFELVIACIPLKFTMLHSATFRIWKLPSLRECMSLFLFLQEFFWRLKNYLWLLLKFYTATVKGYR